MVRMIRRVLRVALLVVGTFLIVTSMALAATAFASQWLHDLQNPVAAQESLPARIDATVDPLSISGDDGNLGSTASPESEVGAQGSMGASAATASSNEDPTPTEPIPTDLPTPEATPDPTPVPGFGRPVRLVIPSIHLDAPVDPMGIRDGVYQVPWWDVGWQNDSAPLGVPGNTVLNGHVLTIDAGKVFYRLKELTHGDLVYVYSQGYRTTWMVDSTRRVPNTAMAFVTPTDDTRLTLYTCEGAFDWKTRTYAEYRVVVAHFVKATETPQP
jgi:LPXTG-site transpeptidase (sortase) family protein